MLEAHEQLKKIRKIFDKIEEEISLLDDLILGEL